MAGYRRLPSGKWQASLRLPDGRRVTRTAALKSMVRAWAEEEERKIRRGEWVDPKIARLTFGQWFDQWSASRIVEVETERGDRSSAARIREAFARRPLGAISRLEVQAWVKQLARDGVGAHAIRRAYNLLAACLNAAIVEGILATTPCRRVTLPPTPPPLPPWFTHAEVDKLVGVLDEPHATMTLAMCWLGLRWGECAGLRVEDVDRERCRVQVVGAMSQSGQWRPYPKTTRSRRELPAPPWLVERMLAEAPASGLLFTTRRQARPLSGSNWRVVWAEAVKASGVPDYTPHACRHTAATWLAQGGATLFDIQVFLGHDSPQTTLRYAHHLPDAAGRIERIWELMAHGWRTDPEIGR